MAVTLTSRERFERMLSRRDHDRIPRADGYWHETITRWESEGLVGGWDGVAAALGIDVRSLGWSWPVPFPGRHEVISEDEETKVVRGSMGKIERLWKNRSGTPEHIAFDCDSAAKWREVYKPALLRQGPSIKPDNAAQSLRTGRELGRWCHFSGIEGFEAMRQLAGDEIVLAGMAEDPDWVRDMSETYTDLILRDFEAALAGGAQADGVWVFGDVGFRNGPFFSPEMYRDIIRPGHIRFCQWAHAHSMKFIYHTDGDVRSLLPLFVDAGFDCIQPMEAKAGMDVREVAPFYGDRLSFFGNIDMTVAATGDRLLIEHEVRTKLAAGMSNRGYAYYSDHSVPPTVSWPTYWFIIELLDKYGRY